MAIEPALLEHYLNLEDLADRDELTVEGVRVPLPIKRGRGKKRHLDWQRRVVDDVMPDSVNADAPERMPFSVVYRLTTNQRTEREIDEVFVGELEPLEPLFRGQALRKKITMAFHVLAVKGAERGEQENKGFSERTLLLLCRDSNGVLDEDLVRTLIDRFRADPSELDLAQRTVLERLQPGWKPDQEPRFDLPQGALKGVPPFDPSAAALFQRDLRTLLDVDLPPADFFHQLNQLLALHMGLYQPRLAAYLNPQTELLLDALASPNSQQLDRFDTFLRAVERQHPFHGSLQCRAPDGGAHRKVTLQTPARQSWQRLSTDLARLHFSILLLVRVRQLVMAWKAHHWGISDDWIAGTLDPETELGLEMAAAQVRDIVALIVDDEYFRAFLEKATTALCVRFIDHQIADTSRQQAMRKVCAAASPLHALLALYEMFNNQGASNAASTRAYRQGITVSSRLLKQGQYGIVQPRARVGPFFELGAGVLPLFLLMVVGTDRSKVNIAQFWKGLAEYGLSFAEDERERLLSRLKAMGVYERYSDAGEAAYVRNLMTGSAL